MSQQTNWVIDPSHSEIGFKVKHMMITNVSGKITSYTGTVSTDAEDFSAATIEFKGNTDSINTGSADRDKHLLSADFFDVEKFPTVEFTATSLTKIKGDDFELKGNLSLHGVTQPVTFAAEFGGIAKDPWGNVKAAFAVTGKINRKDFGLTWNAALETGGVLVSDEVKLFADIQLIKQ